MLIIKCWFLLFALFMPCINYDSFRVSSMVFRGGGLKNVYSRKLAQNSLRYV